MKITCRKKNIIDSKKNAIIIPIFKGSNHFERINNKELVSKIKDIINSSYFTFEKQEIESFLIELSGKLKKVYLLSIPKEPLEYRDYLELGFYISKTLRKNHISSLSFLGFEDIYKVDDFDHTKSFIEGILFGYYSFENYIEDKKELELEEIEVITKIPSLKKYIDGISESLVETHYALKETKDLINQPGNALYPENFAQYIEDNIGDNVEVEIYRDEELKKNNFNLIYAVGMASKNKPRLVKLKYVGAPKDSKNIALVGKGVTFDSGGMNIKPTAGMFGMEKDMAGAAVVYGVVKAISSLKLPVNINAYLPLCENMVDSNALKPGDVIKSYSGKTVQIANTDAEGRLILADALFLATKTDPEIIIDLATLTGGVSVALGDFVAGMFSNRRFLSKNLQDLAFNVGEDVWELPLVSLYDKDIKSNVADLKNINLSKCPSASSIYGALFLQHFVDNYSWIHLDIAGVTNIKGEGHPWLGSNVTGFGVRLIKEFITKYYLID